MHNAQSWLVKARQMKFLWKKNKIALTLPPSARPPLLCSVFTPYHIIHFNSFFSAHSSFRWLLLTSHIHIFYFYLSLPLHHHFNLCFLLTRQSILSIFIISQFDGRSTLIQVQRVFGIILNIIFPEIRMLIFPIFELWCELFFLWHR